MRPTCQELEQRIEDLKRKLTKLKRPDEALEESEKKYRTLFNDSRDAIYISSREGKFLDVNPALLELFGYSREEIVNKLNVREIYVYPGDRDKFKREIEKRGSVGDYEVKLHKKNGTEMDCLITSTVRRSKDGSILGYQGIIRDITEWKRIERLRDDVHRMVRHDLKSPLTGVRGLAGLLLKGDGLTDKQRKTIGMIQELGERMLAFIDRTRDFFQMEEGSYVLKPQDVNLIGIFRRIEKTLGTLTLKKKVDVVFALFGEHTDLETEYMISGEEGLLEILFANLIKNAIEASPVGGSVRISVNTSENSEETFHLIDIHNMGVVPMDVRENFFKPYITSGKEGGTGLGTHNALLVARAHKGDIRFSTSEDEGTHLEVMLPKNLAHDQKTASAHL
ncbi:MAG: PAS domain S-box protein [Deltaproteobacteria bacterium]|nr:PAS domain S-box protein [Deltaproteobacteria bacterium]